MRKYLLAGLGLFISASSLAADLSVGPAPAPVTPSSTGLYIGVHAGAAWQSTPTWRLVDPSGFFVPTSVTSNNGGGSALGAVGGIQGGYNWQFAPEWVVGIEGDISWTSLSDHRTVAPLTIIPGGGAAFPGTALAMSANTEWLSSVRGRLGFTGWFNNTMLYATGGVAWAGVEDAAQTTIVSAVIGPAISFTRALNTTKNGWVLGGGGEWMATPNILIRAEYLYYRINNAITATAEESPPILLPIVQPNSIWSSYNVQVFRIAGSYKF